VRASVNVCVCTSMPDTDRMPMMTLGHHTRRRRSAARGRRTPMVPHR